MRFSFYTFALFCFVAGATGCNSTNAPSPNPSPSAGPSGTPTSTPTGTPTPTPTAKPTATPTTSPRPSTAANITVCPGGTTMSGTDVSDYQPGTDWTTVAHTGLGFAFVKATEGTDFTNADFSRDWPAVASNGMVRGAYHYYHPEEDPVAQANYYLSVVGAFQSTDLPPMLDWEVTDSVSTATDVANAVSWLQTVAAASGKTPIIYVSSDFLNALGNPQELMSYPLFVANYSVTCPSVPPPWSSWVFWQSSDTGSIAGITGENDLDTFNGSLSDLKLFASTGVY